MYKNLKLSFLRQDLTVFSGYSETHCVAQASLGFPLILVHESPECWDNSCKWRYVAQDKALDITCFVRLKKGEASGLILMDFCLLFLISG